MFQQPDDRHKGIVGQVPAVQDKPGARGDRGIRVRQQRRDAGQQLVGQVLAIEGEAGAGSDQQVSLPEQHDNPRDLADRQVPTLQGTKGARDNSGILVPERADDAREDGLGQGAGKGLGAYGGRLPETGGRPSPERASVTTPGSGSPRSARSKSRICWSSNEKR